MDLSGMSGTSGGLSPFIQRNAAGLPGTAGRYLDPIPPYDMDVVSKERPDLVQKMDSVRNSLSAIDAQIKEHQFNVDNMEHISWLLSSKKKTFSILWKAAAVVGTAAVASMAFFTAAPLALTALTGIGAALGTAWLASRQSHYDDGAHVTQFSAGNNKQLVELDRASRQVAEGQLHDLEKEAYRVHTKKKLDEMVEVLDPEYSKEKGNVRDDEESLWIDEVKLKKKRNTGE